MSEDWQLEQRMVGPALLNDGHTEQEDLAEVVHETQEALSRNIVLLVVL
jgi:hypothetical protein